MTDDEIIRDLLQFGHSHDRNGERRTADLLFKAADHIRGLSRVHNDERKADRARIARFVGVKGGQ